MWGHKYVNSPTAAVTTALSKGYYCPPVRTSIPAGNRFLGDMRACAAACCREEQDPVTESVSQHSALTSELISLKTTAVCLSACSSHQSGMCVHVTLF